MNRVKCFDKCMHNFNLKNLIKEVCALPEFESSAFSLGFRNWDRSEKELEKGEWKKRRLRWPDRLQQRREKAGRLI